MRTRTRLLAVVAGLAAASIALSGCISAMIPTDQGPTTGVTASPDTEGVAADLLPFYGQKVEWKGCGKGMDCATVKVPLDWSHPTKGDVKISVIRHSAPSATRIGSLLTNPGGPGASGVSFVRDSLSAVVDPTIEKAYDVIGFDPRGVGGSTSVACYDAKSMDSYLFDIPTGTRGSAAWNAQQAAANKGFANACDRNSAGMLQYITTDNAARDMDVLRAVLGEKKLDYLGYSYGTFLGATYAKLFPKRVGRFVLDGAIDPSVSELDVSTTQALGFESALRAYMADCLKQNNCPFRGTTDDAMADLGTLLASVDAKPLKNSDGRYLGADSLMTAIVAALYSQDSWPYLTQALSDTLSGDASTAFQLVDFYYNRNANGTYSDNSTEAFNAYNCMDYPDDFTQAEKDAASALVKAKAPTIAPYWVFTSPCDSWAYPASGVREKIAAEGAAPIVVVGTTNDPATPYAWSVSLAKQLSSGVLVTRVGEGHTGYNKGNTCVDSAIDEYLLKGTPPENGLRCG
ncbi:alpha/beta hydrolase [Microbacterium sp. ASV49]|uniref:Alpha/beta hydrolase n=1 Tax=Microbacterium candidum TaxID=3041922 RepID=A0ABT7N2U5_9MICO|nr:alpha/beta hydrolase [Microbacterium sp. ASV49]MDL9981033.1 alpha/beta hydrolase [Microbacterium sp. ASV49]